MRLQVYIIAVLVTSLAMGLVVGISTDLLDNYGVSYNSLTNDTPIGATISNISMLVTIQNETLTTGSYAPGQENSQLISTDNPSGSIQLSAFSTALKFIDLAVSYPKLFVVTFGAYYGLPEPALTTISTILYSILILFIIGIVFYRPF